MSQDTRTRTPSPDGSGDHPGDLAWLTLLQHEFATTTRLADPAVAVPWCGRWRVRDLVVHLARIHHWAAGQASRKQETPLGRGPFDLPELYERCAAELRDTLGSLDPDARAWTLLDDGVPRAQQRGTVAFWHRRQKLETLVHLWDLRTALCQPLGLPVDEDAVRATWHDCVDEVVTVMHPRQVRLGRVPPPAVEVRLRTDDGAAWQLAGRRPDRRWSPSPARRSSSDSRCGAGAGLTRSRSRSTTAAPSSAGTTRSPQGSPQSSPQPSPRRSPGSRRERNDPAEGVTSRRRRATLGGMTTPGRIDWREIGRGGSRAVSRPSLVIAVGSGLMVLGLLAATLPLSGFGAWIVRFAALLLAVPVVWLVVRRRSVLARLAEMERTGEHPDNVVHTTTADGQSIEVIVAGAEQTVVPRVGVGSLAALSLASLASGGLAFGLLVIVGLAQLF